MKKVDLLKWFEENPTKSILLLVGIFMGIIPVVTGISIANTPFNLIPNTDNNDWLAYWSTYGGNIVGLLGLALVTMYQDKKQQQYIENQKSIDDNRLRIDLINGVLSSNFKEIKSLQENVFEIFEKISDDYIDAMEENISFDITEYSREMFRAFTGLFEINDLIERSDELLNIDHDSGFAEIINKANGFVSTLDKIRKVEAGHWEAVDLKNDEFYQALNKLRALKYDIYDYVMDKNNIYQGEIIKEIKKLKKN